MCSKPPKPKKVEEKPVQYLRNPFLDGLEIGNTGRNALRIDLAGSSSPRPFEGSASGSLRSSPKSSTPRERRAIRGQLGALVMPGLVIPGKGNAPYSLFAQR